MPVIGRCTRALAGLLSTMWLLLPPAATTCCYHLLLPPAAAPHAELEKLTDKRRAKRYKTSVFVLTQPSALQQLQEDLLDQQQHGVAKKGFRCGTQLSAWLDQRYNCWNYSLVAKGADLQRLSRVAGQGSTHPSNRRKC